MAKPRSRLRVEDVPRIDARLLTKLHAFDVGSRTRLTWRQGTAVTAMARLVAEVDALAIEFDSGAARLRERVHFTPAFLAPSAWKVLVCPRCKATRLHLLVHDGAIGCRGCFRACNATASVSALERASLVRSRLDARLGPDGARPQAMSARAYRRAKRIWLDAGDREFLLSCPALFRGLGLPPPDIATARSIVDALPELSSKSSPASGLATSNIQLGN